MSDYRGGLLARRRHFVKRLVARRVYTDDSRMPERDPLAKYLFRIEIEGISQAGFRAATGLSWEHEVLEFQEGGRNASMVRLPGQQRLGTVTLTRGFLVGAELARWAREARELGETAAKVRRPVDLVLLHDDLSEAARYTLLRAWPSKFETQGLATQGEGLVETLELAHEGLMRTGQSGPRPSPGQALAQGAARARLDAASQAARDAARAARGPASSVSDALGGAQAAIGAVAAAAAAAEAAAQLPAMPPPPAAAVSALDAAYGAAQHGGSPSAVAGASAAAVSNALLGGESDPGATPHASPDDLRAACAVPPAPSGAPPGAPPPGGASNAGMAATGVTGAPATQQGQWSDGVERRQPPGEVPEPPIEPGNTLAVRP